MNLYKGSSVARLDQHAIHECGVDGTALMEQAGQGVLDVLDRHFPDRQQVLVIAGVGNNGGDGFVVARRLAEAGEAVHLYCPFEPGKIGGDAASAVQRWSTAGCNALPDADAFLQALRGLAKGDVVVDGLFGTGLTRPIEGGLAELVRAINAARTDGGPGVCAIDVPSGIDSDEGSIRGAVVKADVTVTMGLDKVGLHTWPARPYCGTVEVVELTYPRQLVDELVPDAILLTLEGLPLPDRHPAGHKGTFGSLAVVGGCRQMPGAPALTALGALRCGAGKVFVWSTEGGHAALGPETMRLGFAESWAAVDLDAIIPDVVGADVLVIGPGMGNGGNIPENLARLPGKRCVVIDADGLRGMGGHGARAGDHVVITPHPGEAAQLLGCNAGDVQENRVAAARQLQDQVGGIVVLKGAGTIVCDGQRLAISPFATAALSVPGSGDVLAGVIGGLAAQGLSPWDAATTGVILHGYAGSTLPAVGNLASEIAGQVAVVLGQLIQD